MLTFIGLAVIWVVLGLFLTMVINTLRVKNGNYNINDWVTVVMTSAIWGPMSILGAFNPEAKAQGKTNSMLLGGIIGTIVFISIYQAL
jgi:hypothetical protein